MGEITSYNFLLRIQNLLCNTDYLELSQDLVENKLDNWVAPGRKALDLTLNWLRKTIMHKVNNIQSEVLQGNSLLPFNRFITIVD